jgi:ABC-type sugar transport system permease subunit
VPLPDRTVIGPRTNRVARRLLGGLVVLAIAVNIAFVVASSRQTSQPLLVPQQARSTQVIAAVALGPRQVLAATNADVLQLFTDGRLTRQRQFDAVIDGFAGSADGKTIYVGTSDGLVTVLSSTLTKQSSFHVNGRVVALAVPAGGGLVVAYGQGVYSDLYYVSYYPHAAGKPAYTTQVGYTITALGVLKSEAIYSLFNSKVGALANANGGKTVWQTTLNYPVSRMLALPATNQILAGDQQGNVTLLDNQGTTLGSAQLSQYAIHALALDPTTGDYVVGDSNGALFALNKERKLLLTRDVADSIAAVLPLGTGRLLVVPGDGPWQVLNAGSIGGQGQAAQLQRVWLVVDAMLLIAFLVISVLAVRRLSALAGAAWRARLGYALVLPAIVLLGVLIYYPAALAIYYSLTNFSLGNVTQFVGLANYQQIITDDFYFRTGMVNMLLIAITSVIKTVTVPLLVAELIFWLRNRVHQYVFRTLFVLPAVVPALVFALLWKQVYDPRTGLLNELLAVLGLSGWQQAWLGNAHTALWAIIGVGFPYVDAFAFLILLGGLLNINSEFFDAAKVDGAGWWSRFRHIDLPLLVAQFRILLFFAVLGTVQGFAGIFILTQGGPGTATYVPALQMYLRISDGDFGYASAIGMILFAMIFVATIFILRFRRQVAIEVA